MRAGPRRGLLLWASRRRMRGREQGAARPQGGERSTNGLLPLCYPTAWYKPVLSEID